METVVQGSGGVVIQEECGGSCQCQCSASSTMEHDSVAVRTPEDDGDYRQSQKPVRRGGQPIQDCKRQKNPIPVHREMRKVLEPRIVGRLDEIPMKTAG